MTPQLVFLAMVCAALLVFIFYDRRIVLRLGGSALITSNSIKEIMADNGFQFTGECEEYLAFWRSGEAFAIMRPDENGITAISVFYRLAQNDNVDKLKQMANMVNANSPIYKIYVTDDRIVEYRMVLTGCDKNYFKRNIISYVDCVRYAANVFYNNYLKEGDIMMALEESRKTIKKRSSK